MESGYALQVIFYGKNVEVSEAIKEYVIKRISKLRKYFETEFTATVRLGVERGRHIVEITVNLDGLIVRGEEDSSDMYGSVDAVVDKLERQVLKYKTRINKKLLRGNRLLVSSEQLNPAEADAGDEDSRVVKVKRFPVKPIPVDEAVMQMNLLGHDFFVFTNSETSQVNVVYRRRDGNYGLLEPDV